jgi:hypothetical protein
LANLTFKGTDFEAICKAIDSKQENIEALKAECETYYKDLDKIIWKSLTDYNWQPYYNEKAVHIDLGERTAWHLWFFEKQGTDFRFREVPNDFPHIHNYHRQEAQPLDRSWTHRWIIPLPLFDVIKKTIDFTLYSDKHEDL